MKTLPKKIQSASDDQTTSEPTISPQEDEVEEKLPTVWNLLRDPLIFSISLSSFALGAIAAAYTSVLVLDAYTSTKNGGLGLDVGIPLTACIPTILIAS